MMTNDDNNHKRCAFVEILGQLVLSRLQYPPLDFLLLDESLTINPVHVYLQSSTTFEGGIEHALGEGTKADDKKN